MARLTGVSDRIRRARARTSVRALVAIGIALASGACSSDPAPTTAPTRATLAADWAIVLPATVTDYAATTIGDQESQVTFGLAPADVDALVSDSGLDLTPGERVVTHASPLWDLNPTGEIVGGTDRVRAGTRAVEIVTDGSTATVRAVLTRSG